MNKKELQDLKKYYNKYYKGMLSKTILMLLIVSVSIAALTMLFIERIGI